MGYGLLATAQENETQFQNLLFIVRDWPNSTVYNFGFNQQLIDKKLTGTEKQTPAMCQLRERILDSFNSIGAFLMPQPGFSCGRRNVGWKITKC